MKNLRTKFILEAAEKLGKFSIEILDFLITSQPKHYKKIRRKMLYGAFYDELFEKPKKLSHEEYKKLEEQRFYNLLNHLQKEGLVRRSKEEKNSFWSITDKGKKKLKFINEQFALKLPSKSYKKENDNNLKIIIFDIPEDDSRKRKWLRNNLVALNFSKLQKSVWIGSIKLPKDFIEDLKIMDIFQYIEIFSVNRTGTIGREK